MSTGRGPAACPGPAQVRLATPADANSIADVLRLAFSAHRTEYTSEAWAVATPDAQAVAARLREASSTWVATRRGDVVGTLSADTVGSELVLRSLAVLPTARGRGTGASLVHAAYLWARHAGLTSVGLETATFLAAAVRLYAALGFLQNGGDRDLHGVCTIWMSRATTTPWPAA